MIKLTVHVQVSFPDGNLTNQFLQTTVHSNFFFFSRIHTCISSRYMQPAYMHLPFVTQGVLSFPLYAIYVMLNASMPHVLQCPVYVSL